MPGKVPPQFLKNVKAKGKAKADPKAAKGKSLPPWLAKGK